MTSLLEKSGVLILELDSIDKFDGLSGIADNSLPVIVTIKNSSVDRKRLNIAHELGHLFLKMGDLDGEQAAFRFAAALLIPKLTMIEILGPKRNNIDLRELLLIKEEYGISMQALVKRCFDLQIISASTYKTMNIFIRSKGLHKKEHGVCYHKEVPTVTEGKLMRAIAEGYTTESEVMSRFPSLAHFVEHGRSVFTDWFTKSAYERDELLQSAAENAKELYEGNGPLADLEIVDDMWEE